MDMDQQYYKYFGSQIKGNRLEYNGYMKGKREEHLGGGGNRRGNQERGDGGGKWGVAKQEKKYYGREEDAGRYQGVSLMKNQRTNSYEKLYRPNEDRRIVLKNSQSQGQLLKRNQEKLGEKRTMNPSFSNKKLPDMHQKQELSQYKKLYDKLDSLQNKLTAMKVNLQKKRSQKQIGNIHKQIHPQQKSPQLQAKSQKSTINSKQGSENILKGIVTQVPKMNRQLHAFDHNPYSPRHNLYYVSEIARAYKQQKSLARQHLLTSMHLLKIMTKVRNDSNNQFKGKVLNLPQKACYKDKKTVVFDLDQTLIHCNQSTSIPHDIALPITFPTGQIVEAGINIRPYAKQILKALAPNFQVVIFTASQSCYANVVLDYLDPTKTLIQHRLYRQHCSVTPEGMHVKDLRVINRKQSELVLVDNAAYSYAFQIHNGIPIIPYYQGKNDYQLKALQTYLQRLIWVPDVREVNKKVFKLEQYNNYQHPETLVEQLYHQWL